MPDSFHEIPSEALKKIDVKTETVAYPAVEQILDQISKLKSRKVNTTIRTNKLKSFRASFESNKFSLILKADLRDLFASEIGKAG